MVTTGGTSLKEDIMHLHQPVHLLVGTAWRIPDLTKKGVCILKHCSMLVLYEADKLLSPEFQPLIQELSHFLPTNLLHDINHNNISNYDETRKFIFAREIHCSENIQLVKAVKISKNIPKWNRDKNEEESTSSEYHFRV